MQNVIFLRSFKGRGSHERIPYRGVGRVKRINKEWQGTEKPAREKTLTLLRLREQVGNSITAAQMAGVKEGGIYF